MASSQSEADIVRAIVKRGLTQANTSDRDGDSKDWTEQDQLKLCMKMWTALNKLLRNQVSKGRVIDTLYFGSFAESRTVNGGEAAEEHYVYCPGPRSIFTLVENSQNLKTIPQSVLEEKLISVSFQAIAEVCNCTAELVQIFFQLLKDEIIELIVNRK